MVRHGGNCLHAFASLSVFMDTCHSGNSHAGGLDEAAYYANIIAYYSARWDLLAVEAGRYGHGAFTQAVIEGVGGPANGDGDRQITTKELSCYLALRVNAGEILQRFSGAKVQH